MNQLTRQKWLSVAIVTAVTGIVICFDGLRSTGPILGIHPMRFVNIVATLVLAMTGPIMWARTSRRFRHVQWLRHRAIVWIHRLAGLGYLPLILLWDFFYETGGENGGEMAVLEAINKPVLIALLASAALLFLKWPRRIVRHLAAIRYFHISAATIYVVKFFAEPLLGGKLG
ncbi:hypothetical protein C5O80_37490 [Burkholderia sp. SRS-46]|nr:hypothetical protein C5O80_37490 [Burkholderia sp. SRS-46]